MLHLAEKHFKTAILNMLKDLKGNMCIRDKQIENFRRETETI